MTQRLARHATAVLFICALLALMGLAGSIE